MDDINKKKEMFKLLYNLLKFHKQEKKRINYKITNGEMKCGFIEYEENEEDEDDSIDIDEQDKNLEDEIKIAIKNYEHIVKYDEFQVFSETFQRLKNENENIVNELIIGLTREETLDLYNLIHVRNVKVEYNGSKIEIPRRTLRIKTNVN